MDIKGNNNNIEIEAVPIEQNDTPHKTSVPSPKKNSAKIAKKQTRKKTIEKREKKRKAIAALKKKQNKPKPKVKKKSRLQVVEETLSSIHRALDTRVGSLEDEVMKKQTVSAFGELKKIIHPKPRLNIGLPLRKQINLF
jgi:hypothetical protein